MSGKKIAITAKSADLDGGVESRFGRAHLILLVDPATMAWQAVDNPGRSAVGGAGIQVARFLSGENVRAVVSGEFGPNAQEALKAAGIELYQCDAHTSARQAVERLKDGDLPRAAPSRKRRLWRSGR